MTALSAEATDGVLELVLAQPPLNEIGLTLLGELDDVVRERLPGARGVLFRSSLERGFCAGADLRALGAAIEARGHEAPAARVAGAETGALARLRSLAGHRERPRRLAAPLAVLAEELLRGPVDGTIIWVRLRLGKQKTI